MATCQQTANCVNKNWSKSGPQFISIPGLDLAKTWVNSGLRVDCQSAIIHVVCGPDDRVWCWTFFCYLGRAQPCILWEDNVPPIYISKYVKYVPPLMDPATDLSTFISIRFQFILVW